jgi:hypothetical protein
MGGMLLAELLVIDELVATDELREELARLATLEDGATEERTLDVAPTTP